MHAACTATSQPKCVSIPCVICYANADILTCFAAGQWTHAAPCRHPYPVALPCLSLCCSPPSALGSPKTKSRCLPASIPTASSGTPIHPSGLAHPHASSFYYGFACALCNSLLQPLLRTDAPAASGGCGRLWCCMPGSPAANLYVRLEKHACLEQKTIRHSPNIHASVNTAIFCAVMETLHKPQT